jgi:hypothetical protein
MVVGWPASTLTGPEAHGSESVSHQRPHISPAPVPDDRDRQGDVSDPGSPPQPKARGPVHKTWPRQTTSGWAVPAVQHESQEPFIIDSSKIAIKLGVPRREPGNSTHRASVVSSGSSSVSMRSRIDGTLPKMATPLRDNTVPITTGTTHAATS